MLLTSPGIGESRRHLWGPHEGHKQLPGALAPGGYFSCQFNFQSPLSGRALLAAANGPVLGQLAGVGGGGLGREQSRSLLPGDTRATSIYSLFP